MALTGIKATALIVIFCTPPYLVGCASVTCDASSRVMNSSRAPAHRFPPEAIPSSLLDAYTRCGQIPTAEYYVDDMHGSARRRQRFRAAQFDGAVEQAHRKIAQVVATRTPPDSLHKSLWLTAAAVAFRARIFGARVAVIGSGSPRFVLYNDINSNCRSRQCHFRCASTLAPVHAVKQL